VPASGALTWHTTTRGLFKGSERISVGDIVSIKPDSYHYSEDNQQTGSVIKDDGTSNPYIVRWKDGTESGWLEPVHLEKVPEKADEEEKEEEEAEEEANESEDASKSEAECSEGLKDKSGGLMSRAEENLLRWVTALVGFVSAQQQLEPAQQNVAQAVRGSLPSTSVGWTLHMRTHRETLSLALLLAVSLSLSISVEHTQSHTQAGKAAGERKALHPGAAAGVDAGDPQQGTGSRPRLRQRC
jgi:hypothetical protein